MDLSRQEYWSGLPFPSPGDLSDLGIISCVILFGRQIPYQVYHLGSWSASLTTLKTWTVFITTNCGKFLEMGISYYFPIFEPISCSTSASNCCFLTHIQVSQGEDKMVQYSHLFNSFPQFFLSSTQSKVLE